MDCFQLSTLSSRLKIQMQKLQWWHKHSRRSNSFFINLGARLLSMKHFFLGILLFIGISTFGQKVNSDSLLQVFQCLAEVCTPQVDTFVLPLNKHRINPSLSIESPKLCVQYEGFSVCQIKRMKKMVYMSDVFVPQNGFKVSANNNKDIERRPLHNR